MIEGNKITKGVVDMSSCHCISDIRDLLDFYEAWPHLRHKSETFELLERLDAGDREFVCWLIKLADRVTRQDLDVSS